MWEKENNFKDFSQNFASDPFIRYGAGVSNYFILQRNLIALFFWLSILAGFQMLIYASFNGLSFKQDLYKNSESFVLLTSLANMGFSTAVCSKTPIDWTGTYASKLSF